MSDQSKENQIAVERGNIDILTVKLLDDISKKLDKLIQLQENK